MLIAVPIQPKPGMAPSTPATYFFRIFRIFAIQAALLYFPLPPPFFLWLVPLAATAFFFRRFGAAVPFEPREPRGVALRPARENIVCVTAEDWPMPEIPARPRRGICGIRFYSLVGLVE